MGRHVWRAVAHGALLALGFAKVMFAAPDTVVVCPSEFQPSLSAWTAHRMAQGHTLKFVPSAQPAEAIRASIRSAARSGTLRYVVLVGDAAPSARSQFPESAPLCPTYLAQAKVNVRFGSEALIATDNWYADLDDNGVPDLAIGRLTADSPQQLRQMAEKIISYEKNADFGPWRRRMNFVAGVGGFGLLADLAIVSTARRVIEEKVPPAFDTTMTFASWQSPYCPDPRRFAEVTASRLSDGCLFWVYIGHGHPTALDWLQVPGARYRTLDVRDAAQVQCRTGAPVACMLACYAGAFDYREDCIAEEFLRNPAGPVAVLAASRVTMPYGMAVLGTELLDQVFIERRPTLGDVLLQAKRRVIEPTQRTALRLMLDSLAGVLSPAPADLPAERAEHVQLMNLLGDPLTRLRYPQLVKLEAPKKTEPGGTLTVTGTTPVLGRMRVELIANRGQLTFAPPTRLLFDNSPETLESYTETYRRANECRWCQCEGRLAQHRFQASLAVPKQSVGPGYVRVYVEDGTDFAVGATQIEIARLEPDTRNAEPLSAKPAVRR